MMNKRRTYTGMKQFKTFEERYEYLRLPGSVGESIFGHDRHLNQAFYSSKRWRATRDKVIIRDEACDLGSEGHDIYDKIIVHHMNPVSVIDLENDEDILYNPEYLVCTSNNTHQAIHYGDSNLLPKPPVVRSKNDTTPWK